MKPTAPPPPVAVEDPIENAVIGATVDAPVALPSDDVNAPPTHFGVRVYALIVLMGVMAAMGPLAIDMYLPAFPTIAGELGVGERDVQRTLASYFVGLALGQLVYGPAADRWGRKRPLYVGLALFAIASVGCALANSVGALVALRFAQALGGCAEMVIARAIVRDRFAPRDAVRVFSGLVLVMGVAPIVAPLLGGFLVGHFSWRAIFWLLAIVGAALIAVTFFLLPESLPPERRARESPAGIARVYGSLLRDRAFMSYALITGLISAALFAYVGGSPIVFMKLFGVPKETFGWYFGAIAAGLIGMAQVNGQLVRRGADPGRLLRRGMTVATVAALALIAFAFTGVGGFWAIYASIWICMSSAGFVFPNAGALAMAPHGRHAGNASALLGFVQFGLSGLGGFIESAASRVDHPSAKPMAVTMTCCVLIAFAIALTTRGTTMSGDATPDAGGH